MRVIEDFGLVVGIDWILHQSVKHANDDLKGKKGIMYARKKIGSECSQGVCEASKVKNLKAGALMVAAAVENCQVFHQLGDGTAWVCAVKDGAPLHGFDAVKPVEEAMSLLTESMSYMHATDLYGDLQGSVAPLGELISRVSKNEAKSCRMIVPSSPLVPMLVIGLGMVAVGGGLYLHEQWEQQRELARQGIALSLAEMQNAEAMARAQAVKQRANEELIATARRTLWHSILPRGQFDEWMSIYKQIPLSHQGWRPQVFECTVETCKVNWVRSSPNVLPSAADGLPGTMTEKSDSLAVTMFRVPSVERREWSEGANRVVLSDLSAKLTGALGTFAVTPPAEAIQAGQPPDTVVLATAGTWRATSGNSLYMQSMLDVLSLPTLEAVSMKIPSIVTGIPSGIEVNGKYRVAQP